MKNWAPIITLTLFVISWQLISVMLDIPKYILPSPLQVAQAFNDHREDLCNAFLLTGMASLVGFIFSLIFGFLSSLLFAISEWLEKGLFPFAVFFQTVPVVAIAPLLILWVGHGFWGVVAVAFIISVFPIISGTTVGLTRCNASHLELFKLHGASTRQRLWKLQIPNALPHHLAGARIAAGLCVIGAIVGEFSAGFGTEHFGLGYLILFTSGQLKTAYLFACIIMSTFLGFLFFSFTHSVGQWSLRKFHLDNSQHIQ